MKRLLLLPVLASSSHAQTCSTLVYLGSALVVTSAPAGYQATVSPPIQGVVVLPVDLIEGTQTIVPAAFDFSPTNPNFESVNNQATNRLANAFSSNPPPSWSFTVSNGEITDWDFSFQWNNSTGGAVIQISSTSQGDSAVSTTDEEYPTGTFTSSNSTPGHWECLSNLFPQPAADPTASIKVASSSLPPSSGGKGALSLFFLLAVVLITLTQRRLNHE